MSLKVIFIGDIVGKAGRRAVNILVPKLRNEYDADLVIANAENIAHGKGITLHTIEDLEESNIDFFTSGNHIWSKGEALEILNRKDYKVIRPANYPPSVPGHGEKILEIGSKKVLVINLMGRSFINQHFDCPFRKLDEILKKYSKTNLSATIVDLHAEATSEKVAFGLYADGRVSLVVGTHTHVVTADERILPSGTGYITDVGMVGVKDSIIGVGYDVGIKLFLTQVPVKHDIPDSGLVRFNAIFTEIDIKNSKTTNIERIYREIEI